MAASLPVLRIKRDNGYGAASLVIKQANKHKELLLLMPKWPTRSLLGKLLPLLPEHGGLALPAVPRVEGRSGVSLTCLPGPSVLLTFAHHR